MNWRNSADRYGALPIAVHWLVFLLMAAAYASIELRVIYPRGSDPREALKSLHFMLGLGVLALVAVRLVLRLSGPVPRIHPPLARLQQGMSTMMHGALYAVMFAMPLLGWLALSAAGKSVEVFGWTLPALVSADRQIAGVAKEAHEILGKLGYVLVGLHVAAALVHHYFIRDDTLRRILPRRRGDRTG